MFDDDVVNNRTTQSLPRVMNIPRKKNIKKVNGIDILLKRAMEGWPHRMLKYFNLDCPQPCGWKENGKILFGKSIDYALSVIRE